MIIILTFYLLYRKSAHVWQLVSILHHVISILNSVVLHHLSCHFGIILLKLDKGYSVPRNVLQRRIAIADKKLVALLHCHSRFGLDRNNYA
jgi:hypothetical protein